MGHIALGSLGVRRWEGPGKTVVVPSGFRHSKPDAPAHRWLPWHRWLQKPQSLPYRRRVFPRFFEWHSYGNGFNARKPRLILKKQCEEGSVSANQIAAGKGRANAPEMVLFLRKARGVYSNRLNQSEPISLALTPKVGPILFIGRW